MKGYTPSFKKNTTEVNSVNNQSFIELGVKQCNENCECETCKRKNVK